MRKNKKHRIFHGVIKSFYILNHFGVKGVIKGLNNKIHNKPVTYEILDSDDDIAGLKETISKWDNYYTICCYPILYYFWRQNLKEQKKNVKIEKRIFDNKKVKFIIVSPRQNHGGPIVLHALCKELSDKGYDAKIFYTDKFYYHGEESFEIFLDYWEKYENFRIKDKKLMEESRINTDVEDNRYYGYSYETVRGCKRFEPGKHFGKIYPFVDKKTIVVYPEVVRGNLLGARNVVRWFLYYNRYKNDSGAYGKNDLFIAFRDVFNDQSLNPDVRKITLYYFDKDTYKEYNSAAERIGNCYIIRKGAGTRTDIPDHLDGPVIDDWSEKRKVEEFNKRKYCISYDMQTGYTRLAAMCGCVPVLIPEEGKTLHDYGLSDEHYGVAFGFSDEQINYAIQTRDKVFLELKECDNRNHEQAEKFIAMCCDHFTE